MDNNKIKKDTESLFKLHDLFKLHEKELEILEVINDTNIKLIDSILFVKKVINIFIFIFIILLFRVFLWDFVNFYLNTIIFWSNLSEGYKILVLGFFITIIATIIADIANIFIGNFIKRNILKK